MGLLRRLLLLPLALAFANFAAYAYARIAGGLAPLALGPDGRLTLITEYAAYARGLLHFDLGTMPLGVASPIAEVVLEAGKASLGLAALSFGLSALFGLALGMAAVRLHSARLAPWLLPVSTLGLATPSFYVGTLALLVGLEMTVRGGPTAFPLPLQGFGWDLHLILPTLALTIRPSMQIAQATASMMAEQSGQAYVLAARSHGLSWRRIRWRHTLRNVLPPVLLVMAGSLRLLAGELVLVERLFDWPGLGKLLAAALIPSLLTNVQDTVVFLNPPLLAALVTLFALGFLLADLAASSLAQWLDPRQRTSGHD